MCLDLLNVNQRVRFLTGRGILRISLGLKWDVSRDTAYGVSESFVPRYDLYIYCGIRESYRSGILEHLIFIFDVKMDISSQRSSSFNQSLACALSISLRSWRDFARESFCFGSEAVNESGEAVRGLVKSPVEFHSRLRRSRNPSRALWRLRRRALRSRIPPATQANYRYTGSSTTPQIGEVLYLAHDIFFPPGSFSKWHSRATGVIRLETEGNLDVLRSVSDSSRLSVHDLKTCQPN